MKAANIAYVCTTILVEVNDYSAPMLGLKSFAQNTLERVCHWYTAPMTIPSPLSLLATFYPLFNFFYLPFLSSIREVE